MSLHLNPIRYGYSLMNGKTMVVDEKGREHDAC